MAGCLKNGLHGLCILNGVTVSIDVACTISRMKGSGAVKRRVTQTKEQSKTMATDRVNESRTICPGDGVRL